jgi:ArsR family transcriptional regulator
MNIENMMVNVFKALSHPVRLKIVNKLIDGELCVCELNEDVEFSQSNISQHLKILRDSDVLTYRKEGLKVIYSIKNREVKDMINLAYDIILREISKLKMER